MDTARPFELSTDLGFLYKSDEHERVFQETLKAIKRREGLICIIGEPGTGKTLLCERFLSEIDGGYRPVLLSGPLEGPNGITAFRRKPRLVGGDECGAGAREMQSPSLRLLKPRPVGGLVY